MSALRGDPPVIPADTPVRLYSMDYCPYAQVSSSVNSLQMRVCTLLQYSSALMQRARLALTAKGVKFDVINCHLKNKPKFLTDAHPNGQVPVLLHEGNVIVESEIIVGEIASNKYKYCYLRKFILVL